MADPAGYFQRGGSFYSSIPPTGGSGAPTTGTWRARQLAVDDTGALWLCTVAGTPGTWVAAGGSASGPPFIGTGTVASTGMFRAANGAANGIYWRNNADNGDIGWSVGAFDNITMAGSATALYLGGGGTKGTVEKLRVGNAATTGDNTANAMFVASATTSKPIVVQGLASQSAKVFEAQDSTGAILASISAAGAVVGASFSGAGSVASTGVLRQANGGGSGVYWRNNAGDGDIGWNVGAFDNIATQGTTALYVTAGGARGTVEKLRVANTATTADNTANALLLASATTSKPLVVQGLASQSAVLTDWQTSTGTSVASVSAAGTVTGAALTAASAGVITGGTAVLSGSVSIGSSPAVTGELKLPAGGAINFRATGGGADIAGISLNSSDQLQVGAPVVPGADNTRALGSTSRRWSQINATKLQLTSTGSLGTVEQLRVGADPITGDNTANALLVASATTSKPLVVQGKASQSANLFEVQDSTGASLFSVGPSGTVTSASLAATYATLAGTSNLIDNAGDSLTGTADNTLGKLAKGTALQVRRMNSAANAEEWATPGLSMMRPKVSSTVYPGWPEASAGIVAGSTALAGATDRFIPFEVRRPITVTDVSCSTTTTAAGKTAWVGIVALNDDMQPSAAVTQQSTLALDSSGTHTWNPTTLTLAAGHYAVCWNHDSTATFRYWYFAVAGMAFNDGAYTGTGIVSLEKSRAAAAFSGTPSWDTPVTVAMSTAAFSIYTPWLLKWTPT